MLTCYYAGPLVHNRAFPICFQILFRVLALTVSLEGRSYPSKKKQKNLPRATAQMDLLLCILIFQHLTNEDFGSNGENERESS